MRIDRKIAENAFFVNAYFSLTFESFAMSSGKPAEAGYDLNCFPQTAAADAGDDFLLIPYAVTPENLRVTRVCGNTVNTKTIVCK